MKLEYCKICRGELERISLPDTTLERVWCTNCGQWEDREDPEANRPPYIWEVN